MNAKKAQKRQRERQKKNSIFFDWEVDRWHSDERYQL